MAEANGLSCLAAFLRSQFRLPSGGTGKAPQNSRGRSGVL
jgi:hypothetical protein